MIPFGSHASLEDQAHLLPMGVMSPTGSYGFDDAFFGLLDASDNDQVCALHLLGLISTMLHISPELRAPQRRLQSSVLLFIRTVFASTRLSSKVATFSVDNVHDPKLMPDYVTARRRSWQPIKRPPRWQDPQPSSSPWHR